MSFLSALGTRVLLHIARCVAQCCARQAHSAAVVPLRVLKYCLVELSGGFLLVACVTMQSPGFAGTVDALVAACRERIRIFSTWQVTHV